MRKKSIIERLKEGLEIIMRYDTLGLAHAEHDQLWAGDENSVENMTDKDKETMDRLGWFISEESWSMWV
jgi:hypothetical protein